MSHPYELWVVDLEDRRAPDGDELAAGLSVEELGRAMRLVSAADGRRWARSRFALRRILSRRLGVTPGDVEFVAGEGGKPSIVGPAGLEFSLAHSSERALVALSNHWDVGVDVERVRGGLSESAILNRILSDAAQLEWAVADPDDRTDVFFRLWARHEAAVKCRGMGLRGAIGIDVADGLTVTDLDVGPGYAAAWASNDPASTDVALTRFDWSAAARQRLRRLSR